MFLVSPTPTNVDTYSAPGQHPLYYLITDSSTLRESALAAFPDRVVLSGLTPHHAELRDSKKKKFVSGAGRMKNDPDGVLQEVEGMTDSMVESWIFASMSYQTQRRRRTSSPSSCRRCRLRPPLSRFGLRQESCVLFNKVFFTHRMLG